MLACRTRESDFVEELISHMRSVNAADSENQTVEYFNFSKYFNILHLNSRSIPGFSWIIFQDFPIKILEIIKQCFYYCDICISKFLK